MRYANRPGGQVTVNMSTDMLDALEQIAYWRNETPSETIRGMVEKLIEAYTGTGPMRLEDRPRYLRVDKRGRPKGSRNREVLEIDPFAFSGDMSAPRKRKGKRWKMQTIDI